jgi:hypothetical protein
MLLAVTVTRYCIGRASRWVSPVSACLRSEICCAMQRHKPSAAGRIAYPITSAASAHRSRYHPSGKFQRTHFRRWTRTSATRFPEAARTELERVRTPLTERPQGLMCPIHPRTFDQQSPEDGILAGPFSQEYPRKYHCQQGFVSDAVP